ncbi:MAG: DUF4389 domain-containing protein [Solirubrobacterales bacterium]
MAANPISYEADYNVEANRLTTFFRLIIVIPWAIWAMLWGIAALVVVFISWFALLFTARYPQGLYDFVAGFLRLSARVFAYGTLLTDELPSFGGGAEPDYAVKVDVAAPQESYHRGKTFFKYFLYFPQYLIASAMIYVTYAAAFVAWFRILFTGKQSITMHEALLVSLAYQTRSTGFLFLLTEAHPRALELQRYEPASDDPGMPPASGGQAVERAGG